MTHSEILQTEAKLDYPTFTSLISVSTDKGFYEEAIWEMNGQYHKE